MHCENFKDGNRLLVNSIQRKVFADFIYVRNDMIIITLSTYLFIESPLLQCESVNVISQSSGKFTPFGKHLSDLPA